MNKISLSYIERRQDSKFFNPTLRWKKRAPVRMFLADGGRFKDYFTKKEWTKRLKGFRDRRKYRNTNGMLKKREWNAIKEKQIKLFGGCVYCGSKERLSLDHILNHDFGCDFVEKEINLVLACVFCNRKKRKLDVFEFCRREKIDVPNVIIERLEIMR